MNLLGNITKLITSNKLTQVSSPISFWLYCCWFNYCYLQFLFISFILYRKNPRG